MNARAFQVFHAAKLLVHEGLKDHDLDQKLAQLPGYRLVQATSHPYGLDAESGPTWFRGYSTSITDSQIDTLELWKAAPDSDFTAATLAAEIERLAAEHGVETKPQGRFALPSKAYRGMDATFSDTCRQYLINFDHTGLPLKLRKGTVALFSDGGSDQVVAVMAQVPRHPGVGTGEEAAYPGWHVQGCSMAEKVGAHFGA